MNWKNFSLKKINTPEYRHVWLLTFWIIYLIVFQTLEHRVLPDNQYHIIYCRLDDIIPFSEYFVVPYLYWFIYMISMLAYSLFFDRECFVYYMKLIMITSTVACITYYVYPTALNLRPTEFVHDNVFTKITAVIYGFDTSTNVCPSMHVTGTLSTLFAAYRAKYMKGKGVRAFMIISAVAICTSTVFMKQHSFVDVVWGVIVATGAYAVVNLRTLVYSLKRSATGA